MISKTAVSGRSDGECLGFNEGTSLWCSAPVENFQNIFQRLLYCMGLKNETFDAFMQISANKWRLKEINKKTTLEAAFECPVVVRS